MLKKIGKIGGIALIVILIAMLTLPFLFKGEVEKMVQKQSDKYLNAHLTFDHLSLNLFRDFPRVQASLNNFMLIGVDSFAKDTLIRSSKLRLSFSLKQLITKDGFRLSKVEFDRADLHIKVLADGTANYDVMKSDTTTIPVDEDTTSMQFDVDQIVLKDVKVFYDDKFHDLLATINGLNASLKGSFSSAITTIVSKLDAQSLSYTQYGYPILTNVHLKADLAMDADMNNWIFVFKSNQIFVNEMELAFEGSIGLPGDDLLFDIKTSTPKVTFKQFLSLVPGFYTNDFKSLKADGKMKVDFFMKGLMTDSLWPAFGVTIKAENGRFQYPSLPRSLDDIQLDFKVENPGGSLDNTKINLSKLHVELGGNPFDVHAFVQTPMSDADFKVGLKGNLNLGMIAEVYPLPEKMKLNGRLDANFSAAGKMSSVEKKKYDKMAITGNLGIQNLLLKSTEMPEILIKTGKLAFTSKEAVLSNLSMLIGKNDLIASGSLQNYLSWFLRNDLLVGGLNVTSNYLNLNDFMSDDTTSQTASSGKLAFQIPANLNLTFRATGHQILFNKLIMKDANALLLVKDGRLSIKDLSAKALGGSIALSGYYEAINPEKPKVEFGLDLKEVSYANTFTTFEFVQKIAPLFQNLVGDYSLKMNFNTELDKNLNPNLMAMNGAGSLQSKDVKVSGAKVFDVLATTLKNENLRNPSLKDLKTSFIIKDGTITTKPFTINVADMNLKLGGTTGLDQHIQYDLNVTLPAKMAVAGITDFSGVITGTFAKPKIQLNTASIAKQAVSILTDKLINKTIGGTTQEAKMKIEAELKQKADALRAQAKNAGDLLVQEATNQGDALVEKAGNPLLKAAAKATAAKLKTEASKKADDLMKKAESEISKLTAAAQSKVE